MIVLHYYKVTCKFMFFQTGLKKNLVVYTQNERHVHEIGFLRKE